MMVPKVLFLVVFFRYVYGESTDPPVKASEQTSLIFRGGLAKKGQFPFMAGLLEYSTLSCGGTIIGRKLILLAAHCFEGLLCTEIQTYVKKNSVHCYVKKSADVKVFVGSLKKTSGIEYDIKKVIFHREYNYSDYKNDIALIQIDGTFEYSRRVKPIGCGDFEVGSTCTAMGWGLMEDGSFPRSLRYLELKTINLDECKRIFGTRNDYYLGEKQFCVLADEGKGVCWADSGGPLVCNEKVVGVLSYGITCGSGDPDVFTKVQAYAEWIRTNSK